jgi:hypothetical protein
VQTAHALTNMGCNGDDSLINYELSPAQVSNLLLAEIVGVSTPAMIKL